MPDPLLSTSELLKRQKRQIRNHNQNDYVYRDLDNSYQRQLVPRTARTQDNSYPVQLVPKSTRTQAKSYRGHLVPRTTRTQNNSYLGQFLHRACRIQDNWYTATFGNSHRPNHNHIHTYSCTSLLWLSTLIRIVLHYQKHSPGQFVPRAVPTQGMSYSRQLIHRCVR